MAEQIVMPDDYMVIIERDDEYNSRPGDFVAWSDEENAEYVAEFERGELTAYVVTLVHGVRRDVVDSLSGCDITNESADGEYDKLDDIPDHYLRSVAAEMVREATS